MSVNRIVPDICSSNPAENIDFYRDFIGLELVMDMGWVMTFASPSNPTAQITILQDTDSRLPQPDISVEVEDIHKIYADAHHRKLPIIYPLTDEPWGVTRFFTKDPNGKIINLVSHTKYSRTRRCS